MPISFTKDNDQAVNFYECIKPKSKFLINITDTSINNFWNDIEKKASNFYKNNFIKLKDRSKDLDLKNFYEARKDEHRMLIRCGFGTGQFCNSALSVWTEFSEDTSLFSQRKSKKENSLYPVTAKQCLENKMPLGWIAVNKISPTE